MSNLVSSLVTIIGAGAYGTAIAIALSKNGIAVTLWGHNANHIRNLKINRSNQIHLPNIFFPELLHLEESLSKALDVCQNVLIAVPSHVFHLVLSNVKVNLKDDTRIIIASKGLDLKTGQFFQYVVRDMLGEYIPFAVIAGPTFARELALGLPTAMILASTNAQFGCEVENLLRSIKNLRVYRSVDVIGVQVAGAIKNIIAIGVGISNGIGFGVNARTALITRGLAEMIRFGIAMGVTSDVFTGLAGLGDLVLTCTDNQSRNLRFGSLLGRGMNIYQAQQDIGQVIEGIYSTKVIYMLSIKYKVIMPITEQVYQVLYNNKNVLEAAYSLLERAYNL